ncbi:hypothetical protein V5799_021283 [Amblyomma americanum]|uniref:Misato Segment II tubulin-like domain-containing protein n=1 Tax=Amblyomma americanum TaxID=6943 RepID=A0AAQ4FNZ9_AMBAM
MQGRVTYTPRLLIADLRGSLGNLKATGCLYDPAPSSANETIAWSGKVTIHKAEPERKVPSGSTDKVGCFSKALEHCLSTLATKSEPH